MSAELAAALCLVLVFEGLFLLISPDLWKRMAAQMQQVDRRTLRMLGGGMVVIGLIALRIVQ